MEYFKNDREYKDLKCLNQKNYIYVHYNWEIVKKDSIMQTLGKLLSQYIEEST